MEHTGGVNSSLLEPDEERMDQAAEVAASCSFIAQSDHCQCHVDIALRGFAVCV
jgi:hypothetical protein